MATLKIDAELDALGVSCSAGALENLRTYHARLLKWNRTMNLTALHGVELIRRLIVEPMWVFEAIGPTGDYVDIGSGNGSPAIPWLSTGSFSRADLIEPRKKRAVFLHRTCRALEISACRVHTCRFSEFIGRFERKGEAAAAVPTWITVQGVRPTADLWREINEIRGRSTSVVWFTETDIPTVEEPARVLVLPHSGRRALVFPEKET